MLTGDYRLGLRKRYVIGLNELQAGFPFPLWALEVVRLALPANARLLCLNGQLYSPEKALELGFVNELIESEQTLKVAIQRAKSIPKESIEAFALTKREFFLQVNERLEKHMDSNLDKIVDLLYSEKGWKQLQSFVSILKNKKQ